MTKIVQSSLSNYILTEPYYYFLLIDRSVLIRENVKNIFFPNLKRYSIFHVSQNFNLILLKQLHIYYNVI